MTGLEKLLRWYSMSGGISTQDATATGNPVTFETTLVRPLVKCEAAFVPIQPGNGNPSQENERPITGFTGLTVYHSGTDTSNPDIYPVTFPAGAGTVYGGYVDLVAGTLTVTTVMYEFDGSSDERWSYSGVSLNRYRFVTAAGSGGDTPEMDWGSEKTSVAACNWLYIVPNGRSADWTEYTGDIICGGKINRQIWLSLQSITTVDELREYLSQHVLQVVVYRQNAITYSLTPQQITALIQTNTLWSDANGDLTVTYKKKG